MYDAQSDTSGTCLTFKTVHFDTVHMDDDLKFPQQTDCFPEQHQLLGVRSGDVECLLWDKNVFKKMKPSVMVRILQHVTRFGREYAYSRDRYSVSVNADVSEDVTQYGLVEVYWHVRRCGAVWAGWSVLTCQKMWRSMDW
jgi:hypothetical protein